MKSNRLSDRWLESFRAYCVLHGIEHDDSFTKPSEMDDFLISDDFPTLLITTGDDPAKDEILGVASLMYSDYFRRGNRSRIRILHCRKDVEIDFQKVYMLLTNFLKDELAAASLDHCFMFIPIKEMDTTHTLYELGFFVERYVYYMERSVDSIPVVDLPEGLEIRPMVFKKDEEAYAHIRNSAFSGLIGSTTPISVEEIAAYPSGEGFLGNGYGFLLKNGEPIGVFAVHEDEDDDDSVFGNIGPIALLKEHQGKGYGRILLRKALEVVKTNGYKKAGLSVNAENSNAARLYKNEGFEEIVALVCLDLKAGH